MLKFEGVLAALSATPQSTPNANDAPLVKKRLCERD